MITIEEQIKTYAKKLGADVCGIGAIERFAKYPSEFSPAGVWDKCRSVVAFGIALPKGLFEAEPRLIYGHYNELACTTIDNMLLKAAKYMEETFDCKAIPMPSDSPYEYWDSDEMIGKGLISMKAAAVSCGLGQMGKSTLLLNETYGNRLVLGIVLTDMELISDPLASNICIPGCTKCIDSCPTGAISADGVNQKTCRLNTYGHTKRGFDTVDCNKCRAICPRAMGKQKLI